MKDYPALHQAIVFLALFTLILGFGYPFCISLISSLIFPYESSGSLLYNESGEVIGSELIGLQWTGPWYFEGRPSGIDTKMVIMTSGGSNYGLSNPLFREEVQSNINKWRNRGVLDEIPSDLVMSSASGFDPHISLNAALIQVPSVASARNLSSERVKALVLANSVSSPLLSEPYVHLLSLNVALDAEHTENDGRY